MSEKSIFDIKNDENPKALKEFFDTLEYIRKEEKHANASMFATLFKEYKNYLCFNVLMDEDTLVGFSGLYDKIYPNGTARALTRTYYSQEYRIKTLPPTKDSNRKGGSYSSLYFLPYQLEYAKTIGLTSVFISMEHIKRRRAAINICNWINTALIDLDKPERFIVLENMYNTCRTINNKGDDIGLNSSPACWQNIMFCKLTANAELPLASISIDEWKNKFLDTYPSVHHKLR